MVHTGIDECVEGEPLRVRARSNMKHLKRPRQASSMSTGRRTDWNASAGAGVGDGG